MQNYIESLIVRYPILENCRADIEKSYMVLEECFASGHKLLICGNGGSCADAEHIVGELMKNFKLTRHCSNDFAAKLRLIDPERGELISSKLQEALPAIALNNHAALNTAFCNDVLDGHLYAYCQQVYGYGVKGDVLLAISTSGNSKNIVNAAVVARAMGINTIGLTGQSGASLRSFADVIIEVPECETYKIQELHLPIYHTLCLMLEKRFGEYKF